ncbi:hypothetical protein CC78DRAFT_596758 [Lojkania enalia]|uniref:Uncharacterized protein n=1 Tax=Lojkania enalia TaxID=147567 RepID=A0A9P4N525_9PLEO|nr:hypothetical protein CC78DRAFT_596758 [Didymosphaeria enalia]
MGRHAKTSAPSAGKVQAAPALKANITSAEAETGKYLSSFGIDITYVPMHVLENLAAENKARKVDFTPNNHLVVAKDRRRKPGATHRVPIRKATRDGKAATVCLRNKFNERNAGASQQQDINGDYGSDASTAGVEDTTDIEYERKLKELLLLSNTGNVTVEDESTNEYSDVEMRDIGTNIDSESAIGRQVTPQEDDVAILEDPNVRTEASQKEFASSSFEQGPTDASPVSPTGAAPLFDASLTEKSSPRLETEFDTTTVSINPTTPLGLPSFPNRLENAFRNSYEKTAELVVLHVTPLAHSLFPVAGIESPQVSDLVSPSLFLTSLKLPRLPNFLHWVEHFSQPAHNWLSMQKTRFDLSISTYTVRLLSVASSLEDVPQPTAESCIVRHPPPMSKYFNCAQALTGPVLESSWLSMSGFAPNPSLTIPLSLARPYSFGPKLPSFPQGVQPFTEPAINSLMNQRKTYNGMLSSSMAGSSHTSVVPKDLVTSHQAAPVYENNSHTSKVVSILSEGNSTYEDASDGHEARSDSSTGFSDSRSRSHIPSPKG